MARNKSLTRQVYEQFEEMFRFGESKHAAKTNEKGKCPEGIFSYRTFQTYMQAGKQFAHWVKDEHGCRQLGDARQYVPEYLQHYIDNGKSPYTIRTYASALSKLYGCSSIDWGVEFNARERKAISNSRSREKNSRFDPNKNREAVDFTIATGLRRHELLKVKYENLRAEGDKLYVDIKGKGGRPRSAVVLDEYTEFVREFAESRKNKPTLFDRKEIKRDMNPHRYRAEYATRLYEKYARPIKRIPTKQRYVCRKELAGVCYDKVAMRLVSENLGHSRIDIIAGHYLYTQKK